MRVCAGGVLAHGGRASKAAAAAAANIVLLLEATGSDNFCCPPRLSLPRSRKYVKPNVQKVHLYSQALGRKLKINVTTAALR